MSEDKAPTFTVGPQAAVFLAQAMQGLANVIEMDGPNQLTDAQMGLIFGPEGSMDVPNGVDRRWNAAFTARGIATSLREQLTAEAGS